MSLRARPFPPPCGRPLSGKETGAMKRIRIRSLGFPFLLNTALLRRLLPR